MDLMYAHDTEGGGDALESTYSDDSKVGSDVPAIDPETDEANEAAVEAFFDADEADEVDLEEEVTDGLVKLNTVLPLPTLSGYPSESYPEAQARGDQFDKGTTAIVATGKSEEAREHSEVVVVDAGPDDAVGKNQAQQEKLARKRDRTEVQNVKLGNAEKNPETA